MVGQNDQANKVILIFSQHLLGFFVGKGCHQGLILSSNGILRQAQDDTKL